jgi:hypothetical protein
VGVVSSVDDGCQRWGVEAAGSICFTAEGERAAAGEGSKARVRRLVCKNTGRLARDAVLEFSSVGNTRAHRAGWDKCKTSVNSPIVHSTPHAEIMEKVIAVDADIGGSQDLAMQGGASGP